MNGKELLSLQELEANLKSFGGDGKLEDGKHIYRQVIAGVVPLGIGLTETPAAEVDGIFATTATEENPSETEQSKQNNTRGVPTGLRKCSQRMNRHPKLQEKYKEKAAKRR